VALFFARHVKLFHPYGNRERVIIADEQSEPESAGDFDKFSLLPLSRIRVETVIEQIDQVLAIAVQSL
jgi:hypothetical protein